MKATLVTDEQRAALLVNGRLAAAGEPHDPLPVVRLSDLASIVGPRKQPVMRDRYFQAARPLSEYLRLAQENGSIVD